MSRMADGKKGSKTDKTSGSGVQRKRNKKADAEGRPYDRRKGTWEQREKAVEENARALRKWLTKERVETELSLLNYPGKRGRPYEYPPSLVLYVCLLKEDREHSYRSGTADINVDLEFLGFGKPDFTTVFKSEGKFLIGDFGYRIMAEASVILAGKGMSEPVDPCMFVRTGEFPKYRAPQIIVDSQRKQDLQNDMDAEAAQFQEMMEIIVLKNAAEDGKVHVGAVDGSGVGISGPGIYFEHIWKVNNRRFIKQHALIDVHTMEVIAFSITMESPCDSAVFIPMIKGTAKAGVKIGVMYADGSYDTINNWLFMDEQDIQFYPNLKTGFEEKVELPERNEQKRMSDGLGKKAFNVLTGYNSRWHVEVFFSIMKKLYGEKVDNRKFGRMVLTMRHRYMLYAIRQSILNDILGSENTAELCWAS